MGDGTNDDAPVLADGLTDPRDLERPKMAEAATIESTGGIGFSPEFASFGSRFVGGAIDMFVTAVMMCPGAAVVMFGSGLLRWSGLLVMAVGFVLAAWLYATSVSTSGQWLGNRVASTTVVDVGNGSWLTPSNAGARFVMRAVISPVLMIGFLIALGNPQRRTFHDQIASSIVTRPARASWSIKDERESIKDERE